MTHTHHYFSHTHGLLSQTHNCFSHTQILDHTSCGGAPIPIVEHNCKIFLYFFFVIKCIEFKVHFRVYSHANIKQNIEKKIDSR